MPAVPPEMTGAGRGREGRGGGADRRRRYLVDRSFQGWFAFRFLAFGLLIAFATGGVIWYLSSRELARHIYRSHLTSAGAWDIVLPVLARSLLVSIGGFLLFAAVFTRSAFRRMAVELRSFDEAMRRIGGGDLATRVPEGGVAELNEKLELARETIRDRVEALKDIQARMAAEAADAGREDGGVRREIETLCASFRRLIETTL